MQRLMILDGNSIVNRAFYAIRLLTNSEGLYTNAIYGFLNILFKYLDEENPEYLCVAFDLAAPTFRHKKYEAYKAQRKGMPDELAQQMPLLKEVLDAMNIPILELEGYEADDIIGTVSRKCEACDMECVILTGDKDDLQLASQKTRIKLVVTKAGSTTTTDYTDTTVLEKYGVTPVEFIDVKGLMGDPSDNIPGVTGIGEKTAFDLIQRFKSIANIYENLDTIDIKPGVRTKLKDGREQAFLSRELAEIDVNVPIDCNVKDYGIKGYNNEKLRALFQKLNFTSFLKRLELFGQETQQQEIVLNTDRDAVLKAIREAGSMYYYLSGGEMAVATDENIITIGDFYDLLSDPAVQKIGFNLKEDMVTHTDFQNPYFDVMIAAYIVDAAKTSYKIDSLAAEYVQYAVEDSLQSNLLAIIKLHQFFSEKMTERDQLKLFHEVEMPLVQVLADMQVFGVAIDKEKLMEFGQMLSQRIDSLTEQIYSYAGCEFNINSPKQLGEVLFEKLQLPVIKKTKSGYSTNVEVLEKLKDSHPIISCIMEYRQFTKLKGTYADGMLGVINEQTGRIHSSFNQTVTVTGRISSTEPNMQNIPVRTELGREMRKMFVAQGEDNVFVDADYSQIELRVLAHIANDKNMIDAFQHNLDIHTITASQVFSVPQQDVTDTMRSNAKAVNFGIVYGIGDFKLSQDLHITRKEAKAYKDSYLANFSGVRDYMEQIVEKAKADGYVTTILNRRRYLPELSASNFVTRAFGERVALNTPIQGSAADIIKIAMVKVSQRLKAENLRARLVLQVHDELIVETHKDDVPQVKEILKHEMENAFPMSVPLSVDMHEGKTWYDAK